MKLKLQMKSKMLYAFLMTLFSVWGWGQSTIASNGAEDGIPTLALNSQGNWVSSNTNSGTPQNQRIKSGSKSFQSTATGSTSYTSTLVSEGISLSGYTSSFVEVWNSSISTTSGNGIDATIDKLEVYVSETSTFSSTPDVLINAAGSSNGNIRWGINGSGVITTDAGTPVVKSYSTSSSNGETKTGSEAFSKIVINLPNAWNNLYIKIIGVNNATSEVWCIDDIAVKGTLASVNPPSVTSDNGLSGSFNTLFNYQVAATEAPNDYSITSGTLPLGLSINSSTGLISGTPQETGIFSFNITATNSNGSGVGSFVINVAKGNQATTNSTSYNLFTGSANISLDALTNASKSISYVSSNPSVISIFNNNELNVVGAGNATITATASGDGNWNPYNATIDVVVTSAIVYQKINSMSELVSGGEYLLSDANSDVIATENLTSGTVVTINANSSNGAIINPAANTLWIIDEVSPNVYTLKNKNTNKFINYVSSTNLSLVDNVTTNNQRWSINFVTNFFNISNVASSTRMLKYNAGLQTPGFKAYETASVLPEVSLYKRLPSSWNGSIWSNGVPTSTTDVIITGVYSTTSNPAFAANNITIKNGGVLEINGTNVINAVNVTVEDGGNLVIKDSGVLNHTGTFKVLKSGASLQDKYAFWSSPVASQNLTAIYPSATPSFITEYNTATDYFVNAASTNSVFGKGYSIKTPAVSNVEFTGTPNNSTQTFTMSTAGNGYNLVGNPYPSNLDLVAFYNANSGRISSNFYFWDNTSNSVTIQGGATTTNIGYATYNPASQVWTPAPNITAIPTENSVKIGQGFIVKATNSTDTSLSFSNDMRTAAPATFYNKNNSSTEGKFWLRLNSSYNTSNTFAVAYLNSASDSFDQYDSKAIGTGSDAFYTIADAQKLVIQGKSAFDINDVVPVGTKHFQNGNFTISLVQKEGIFNNGQVIYLYDKVTGTYTDLQNSAYSFTANSGEVSSRFEIVYKLGVLSTSEVTKDSFEVYRNGENFFVRNNKNIESVIVYDASGRKIQTIEGGSKEIRITLNEKGVYIVKASSQGKEYTKKIIK